MTSTAPDLDVVELDPRARTVQARVSDPENDPRLDDRDPKRFKLIYNGVGAVVNLSNQTLGLLIDASVRRNLRPQARPAAPAVLGPGGAHRRDGGVHLSLREPGHAEPTRPGVQHQRGGVAAQPVCRRPVAVDAGVGRRKLDSRRSSVRCSSRGARAGSRWGRVTRSPSSTGCPTRSTTSRCRPAGRASSPRRTGTPSACTSRGRPCSATSWRGTSWWRRRGRRTCAATRRARSTVGRG